MLQNATEDILGVFEEVRFDRNGATRLDSEPYPVLHVDSVLEKIEIVLIERPEAAPSAEIALGLVPAAIGNGIRRYRCKAASGCRSRPSTSKWRSDEVGVTSLRLAVVLEISCK